MWLTQALSGHFSKTCRCLKKLPKCKSYLVFSLPPSDQARNLVVFDSSVFFFFLPSLPPLLVSNLLRSIQSPKGLLNRPPT